MRPRAERSSQEMESSSHEKSICLDSKPHPIRFVRLRGTLMVSTRSFEGAVIGGPCRTLVRSSYFVALLKRDLQIASIACAERIARRFLR